MGHLAERSLGIRLFIDQLEEWSFAGGLRVGDDGSMARTSQSAKTASFRIQLNALEKSTLTTSLTGIFARQRAISGPDGCLDTPRNTNSQQRGSEGDLQDS